MPAPAAPLAPPRRSNPFDPAGMREDIAGAITGTQSASPIWRMFQPALGTSLDMAGSLAATENERGAQTRTFLTREFERANQADRGMGQDEIDLRMGRVSDSATGQSLDQWKGLRDQLGAAGVTGGGLAAGLGSQIELGRLGQIQGGKRDIAIAEAERRSQSASNQFMRAMGLGSFLSQGDSMLQLDQFNSLIDTGFNTWLGGEQIHQGDRAIRAQAKAGKQSMMGSIIGGGLSLLGSL